MLKILGIVGGVLLIALLGLLAFAATKPDTFRVARSTVIAAPPEKIFPMIEDFHRWRGWSPYEELDADLKRTYGGAAKGVGATYAWDGKKAGAGRMEIVEASTPREVMIQLDFTKPMTTRNTGRFTLEPSGGGTKVTWSMEGPSPYVTKLMDTLFNMDAMLGKDFETGLANIKAAAEQ